MNKNYSSDSRSKINNKPRLIHKRLLLKSIIQALRFVKNYEIYENSNK
jgi:hypothetical protein